MGTIFCHGCAIDLGHLASTGLALPSRSTYQYDKHVKHTQVSATYPLVSVFASPSTKQYDDYFVNASLAGAVEFDDQGRRNIIWGVGELNGFRYEHGTLVRPTDAVKIVLSTDPACVHAFPENSTTFFAVTCQQCGGPVLH